MKLPALLCYLLFNQSNNEKIKNGLPVTVNVALVLVGVGEVKAAMETANYARMMVAAGDLGLSAADILIQGPFKAKLERENPDFLKRWDTAVLLYSLGRLGYEGIDNLVKDASELKKLRRAEGYVFDEKEQNTLQKMLDKLQDIKGAGATKATAVASRLTSKYKKTYDWFSSMPAKFPFSDKTILFKGAKMPKAVPIAKISEDGTAIEAIGKGKIGLEDVEEMGGGMVMRQNGQELVDIGVGCKNGECGIIGGACFPAGTLICQWPESH